MVIFVFIFLVLAALIAIFQLILALGAPLGEYTMGGRFPGKLPVKMRVAALIQIVILMVFAFIVLAKQVLHSMNTKTLETLAYGL